MELPKEKRPTDKMIFDFPPEELDQWLDQVLNGKQEAEFKFDINEAEIE